MARRRNLKEPEPVESAAEAGYVSPPKKRKAQQNVANDKPEEGKETNARVARLPRAAKSSKTEQIEVEVEPAKKSRTTGKAVQPKKSAASSTEQTSKATAAKSKRAKNPKTELPTSGNVNDDPTDMEDLAEPAAKKTRGKPPKKAGTDIAEKNESKPARATKKTNLKENLETAEEPAKKKGRAKKESKPKEKVEKQKVNAQHNSPQKKAPKSKAKAAANIDTQDNENKMGASNQEENEKPGNVEKVVATQAKSQGKKKIKTSIDNVVTEEEEVKVNKGRQAKTAKGSQNDKPPAKKGRGKKQTVNTEKEEADAEPSTKEVSNEKKGSANSSTNIDNKRVPSESDNEAVDETKVLSPATNPKEPERNSNDTSTEEEN